MSRGVFQRTIVNELGNVLPNATVTVRDQGGALVALFDSAEDGAVIPNPFTADGDGFARFYTAPGLVDVTAVSGANVRTWSRVVIAGTAAVADSDEFVGVTGTQSIDGVKTFMASPIVPTATTGFQAATYDQTVGQMLGVGQTWQDVSGSRSAGVTYTNSTGQPIFLAISANQDTGAFSDVTLTVDGVIVSQQDTTDASDHLAFAIVPDGSSYILTSTAIGSLIWAELRK